MGFSPGVPAVGLPHQTVRTLLGLESGHGERLRVHLTHGARGPPRPRPRLQAQASGSASPGVRRIPSPASPGPAPGSIPCCQLHPGRLGTASISWIQSLLPALSLRRLPRLPPARPRLHGSSLGSRRSVSKRRAQARPLQAPPRPIPFLTGRRRPRLQPRPQRALRWVAGGTRRRQRCSSFFVFRQRRPRESSTACPLGPPAPALR